MQIQINQLWFILVTSNIINKSYVNSTNMCRLMLVSSFFFYSIFSNEFDSNYSLFLFVISVGYSLQIYLDIYVFDDSLSQVHLYQVSLIPIYRISFLSVSSIWYYTFVHWQQMIYFFIFFPFFFFGECVCVNFIYIWYYMNERYTEKSSKQLK